MRIVDLALYWGFREFSWLLLFFWRNIIMIPVIRRLYMSA